MQINFNYNTIESIRAAATGPGPGPSNQIVSGGLVVNLHYSSTNGSGSWFDLSGNNNTFTISGSLINSGSNGWAFNGDGTQLVYFTGSQYNSASTDAFSSDSEWTVQAVFIPVENIGPSGSRQVLFGSNNFAYYTSSAWGLGTPWTFNIIVNDSSQSFNSINTTEGTASLSASSWYETNVSGNVSNNNYPLNSLTESVVAIASSTLSGSNKYFNQSLVLTNDYPTYKPSGFRGGKSDFPASQGFVIGGTNNPTSLSSSLSIGDFYGGGIVAYISGTFPNELAIIVATASIGAAPYGSTNTFTYATASAIGTGGWNTQQILNAEPFFSGAAQYAVQYRGGGYDDWILPSAGDLVAVCNSGVVELGDVQFDWTSTELDDDFAYYLSSNLCQTGSVSFTKSATFDIWPVRYINSNTLRQEIISANFNAFKGTLKQVLIYNRQLSGAELNQNYIAIKLAESGSGS